MQYYASLTEEIFKCVVTLVLVFPAELLREDHQRRCSEEDRDLLASGDQSERGGDVRLQVPDRRQEDPVLLWRHGLSRVVELRSTCIHGRIHGESLNRGRKYHRSKMLTADSRCRQSLICGGKLVITQCDAMDQLTGSEVVVIV